MHNNNSYEQQIISEKPEWLKNNVNGWVVQQLKKIRNPKDLISYYLDTQSGQLENAFEYQGKKIGIGVIVHGVEVGDQESGTPQYIAPLGDIYRVPDFLTAIRAVEQEKGIQVDIGDTMDFEQCIKDRDATLVFNPIYMMKDKGLKDLPKMKEITEEIMQDIGNFLGSEYEVILNNVSYRIIISPKNESAKQKIITHDAKFEQTMDNIVHYRKTILPQKMVQVDQFIADQKTENEMKYNQTFQIIDMLRNQL